MSRTQTPLITVPQSITLDGKDGGSVNVYRLDGSRVDTVGFATGTQLKEILARLNQPPTACLLSLDRDSPNFQLLFNEEKLSDYISQWGEARASTIRVILAQWPQAGTQSIMSRTQSDAEENVMTDALEVLQVAEEVYHERLKASPAAVSVPAAKEAAPKKQKAKKEKFEGWLQKINKKGKWQDRFCRLTLETTITNLEYFTSPRAKKSQGRIRFVEVTDVQEGPTKVGGSLPTLQIVTPDRTYEFCATTPEDHKQWMIWLPKALGLLRTPSTDKPTKTVRDDPVEVEGEVHWNELLKLTNPNKVVQLHALFASIKTSFRKELLAESPESRRKAGSKLSDIRVLHSAISKITSTFHTSLRRELVSSLLTLLKEPQEHQDMLEVTIDLITREHLEQQLDVELDECIRFIVNDELADIREDVSVCKEWGNKMSEIVSVCTRLQSLLDEVHEVQSLFPKEFEIQKRFCDATHRGVLEKIMDRVLSFGEENLLTEDALAMLSWAVGFQETLTRYHPGLEIAPRFKDLSTNYYGKYQNLLRDKLASWVTNITTTDEKTKPMQVASEGGNFWITSAPEDLFQTVGEQMRLAIQSLKGVMQGETAALIAKSLDIYHQAKVQWLDQIDDKDVSEGDDLERLCALINNNTRAIDQLDSLSEELKAQADDVSKSLAVDPLQEQLDRFEELSALASTLIARCIAKSMDEIFHQLFTKEWVADSSHQALQTIHATVNDYLNDLSDWMDNFHYERLVSDVMSQVCSRYIEELLTAPISLSVDDHGAYHRMMLEEVALFEEVAAFHGNGSTGGAQVVVAQEVLDKHVQAIRQIAMLMGLSDMSDLAQKIDSSFFVTFGKQCSDVISCLMRIDKGAHSPEKVAGIVSSCLPRELPDGTLPVMNLQPRSSSAGGVTRKAARWFSSKLGSKKK